MNSIYLKGSSLYFSRILSTVYRQSTILEHYTTTIMGGNIEKFYMEVNLMLCKQSVLTPTVTTKY